MAADQVWVSLRIRRAALDRVDTLAAASQVSRSQVLRELLSRGLRDLDAAGGALHVS